MHSESSFNPGTHDELETGNRYFLALLVAAVTLVYAPVSVSMFAYGDDFAIFFDDSSEIEEFLSAGRPGLVIADLTVHRAVRRIEHLRLLRAVSICGAVLLAAIYYLLARRWFHLPACLCLSVSLMMLPSIQEYVAAAHNWTFTTIAAASTLAAWTAQHAFSAISSRYARWLAVLAAFVLMAGALLTYQPAAMWYWPATLFFILDERFLDSADYRRATLKTIISGLIFVAIAFVAMKVVLHWSQVTLQGRGQLMTDPLSKLYWFARMQLTQGLNLWQIYSGNKSLMLATAAFTGGLIGAAYVWEIRRQLRSTQRVSRWQIALQAGSLVVVVLASHCHWLAVVNMTQNYRVAGALCASVLVLFMWSLRQLVSAILPSTMHKLVLLTLLAAITVISMVKCQSNLHRYFIDPYNTAYRYVLASLRSELTPSCTHIHLIRQQREDGLVTEELTQPFGWPFSMWTTEGLVELALRDAGVPHQVQEISSGEKEDPVPATPEIVVIDMAKLVQFRLASE